MALDALLELLAQRLEIFRPCVAQRIPEWVASRSPGGAIDKRSKLIEHKQVCVGIGLEFRGRFVHLIFIITEQPAQHLPTNHENKLRWPTRKPTNRLQRLVQSRNVRVQEIEDLEV